MKREKNTITKSKCSAAAGSKASLRRPQSRFRSHHPHPFAILEFRNVVHPSQPAADLRLPPLPTRWWIRLAGGSSSSPAGGSTRSVSSVNHANKSFLLQHLSHCYPGGWPGTKNIRGSRGCSVQVPIFRHRPEEAVHGILRQAHRPA